MSNRNEKEKEAVITIQFSASNGTRIKIGGVSNRFASIEEAIWFIEKQLKRPYRIENPEELVCEPHSLNPEYRAEKEGRCERNRKRSLGVMWFVRHRITESVRGNPNQFLASLPEVEQVLLIRKMEEWERLFPGRDPMRPRGDELDHPSFWVE